MYWIVFGGRLGWCDLLVVFYKDWMMDNVICGWMNGLIGVVIFVGLLLVICVVVVDLDLLFLIVVCVSVVVVFGWVLLYVLG